MASKEERTSVETGERDCRRPRHAAFAVGVLILSAIGAYSNTFHAPFQFDDHAAIIDNESLRHFWALHWLSPRAGGGSTVSGRPVLAFSFALNYAMGALSVGSYHAVNLAIHLLSTLALFGVVRRTLRLPLIGSPASRADAIAFVATALWSLHPLQTEAVTYIVQRAESLMALFYLLTFYCFVRGVASPYRRVWWSAAVTACWAGMGTKEVMVSAPLLVLLFDRAYIAGGFRQIWETRKTFYAALATSWLPLIYLVASLGGNRGGTTGGFGATGGALTYWLTQFPAIFTYLKLAGWPSPLVFEYGPVLYVTTGYVIVSAGVVLGLICASITAWFRAPELGFLGLFLLAILAPTSLVPGTLQAIVEHRFYLALAPLVVFVAYLLEHSFGRRGLQGLALVAIVFGAMTFMRNLDYRSEISLWSDTVQKRPNNPHAYNNLGRAYDKAGAVDLAIPEYRRAVELQPNHAFAHANLGADLIIKGNIDEAIVHLRTALSVDSNLPDARVNLARALNFLGKTDEAMKEYQIVLAAEPKAVDARTNLAALLIEKGRLGEAVDRLRSVISAAPDISVAHYYLGLALDATSGRGSEARAEFREALRLKPDFAEGHLALANALAHDGAEAEAEHQYHEALRFNARLADAHYGLGNLAAKRQDFEAAVSSYRVALSIDPHHVGALNNLANCQLATGHVREAIESYEQVLKVRPRDQSVRQNLQLAREMLSGRGGAATP